MNTVDPEWRDRLSAIPAKASPIDRQDNLATKSNKSFSTISAAQGPQQKLRLIFKTGTEEAFDYSYNSRTTLDGGRITLRYTTGEVVTIEGRNLNVKQGEHPPLFRSLVDHLVTSIYEIDPLDAESECLGEHATVITKIEIQEQD